MLGTFGLVTPFLKFRYNSIRIDNIAFQLHYKWTFALLIVCTILVTSRQYIGDHIRCISEGAIPNHVINTFCFFTTTFTIANHMNESALQSGAAAHPGVGPFIPGKDAVKHHAYYQWVPFVLFAQALLFYIPHALWKSWEDGKLIALTRGLKMIAISKYLEKGEKLTISGMEFPSKDATDYSALAIKTTFVNRLKINKGWGTDLIIAEFLNLFNVLFQIYFVNFFLGGQFLSLGPKVLHEKWGSMDILDVVFPKITKCLFRKFGPSGSLQVHDALCVMALNVINEKIYTILWFWLMFMLAVSILALVWRFITIVFHKRSSVFNTSLFSYASSGPLNRHEIEIVTRKCSFSNWLFLYYLASNLDGYVFRQILYQISDEFTEYEQEVGENEANQQSEDDVKENLRYAVPSTLDTVDGSSKLLEEKEKLG